ncbi:MAG: hypothetical protein KI791_06130 [Cyclobacteriaceae bacterium]|nr:hypothetical protein [Cyclobacteriaceae bacterium SS2]
MPSLFVQRIFSCAKNGKEDKHQEYQNRDFQLKVVAYRHKAGREIDENDGADQHRYLDQTSGPCVVAQEDQWASQKVSNMT